MCGCQNTRSSPRKLGCHRPHNMQKLCRGCGRHSHPSGSRNHRDCPMAKMASFSCEIIRHIERVCQKPKGSSTNRSMASGSSVHKRPRRRTGQSSKVNWRDKANNPSHSWKRTPEFYSQHSDVI